MRVMFGMILGVIVALGLAGIASANDGCGCNKCATKCCKPACKPCCEVKPCCKPACENKCENKCESNCGRSCGCGGCRPECHWYPNLVERQCCDIYLEMRERSWLDS